MTVAESLKKIKNPLKLLTTCYKHKVKFEGINYSNIVAYAKYTFIDGSFLEARIYETTILTLTRKL